MCNVVLGMSGHTTWQLANAIASTILVLALNALLITRWGLLGAAVASLVFTVVMSFVRIGQVFGLLRLFPYNLSFLKPIVAGLVTLAAALIVRQALHAATDIVAATTTVVVLLGVYAGMILLLGLSEEDQLVLSRIRRRLGTLIG
jgi:O-antigen/teichoic acid export membrane protein